MIPRRSPHVEDGEFAWFGERLGREDRGTIAAFEAAIAALGGRDAAVAVGSGREGLRLILEALPLRRGDEVVIPAYTLGALVSLIRDLGLRPVAVDVDSASFSIDPAAVDRALTGRTKAVLVLHAFGAPCAVDEIGNLCRRRGLFLIEDCAHALGTRSGGRPAGSFGDAAFFSFETAKPLNTYGGGAVVARDPSLVAAVRRRVEDFIASPAHVRKKVRALRLERLLFATGLAAPLLLFMDLPAVKSILENVYRSLQSVPPQGRRYLPVQAGLGLRKLQSLEERLAGRQAAADRYRALLDPAVVLQQVPRDGRSTWYFLVALLPRPAAPLRRQLLLRGVDVAAGSEIADNCAALCGDGGCPVTEALFERAVALPIYDGIPDASVQHVAAALNAVLRGGAR